MTNPYQLWCEGGVDQIKHFLILQRIKLWEHQVEEYLGWLYNHKTWKFSLFSSLLLHF